MNRTGLLAALSAAAIVGLPMTTAAPAAAVPYVEQDDPPPATDAPESAAPDAAVVLEVIPVSESPVGVDRVLDTDDPVSESDVDEVVLAVAQPADPVLDAVEQGGIADLREDEVEAAADESAPAPNVPDSPAGEEKEGEGKDAPTGDFNDAAGDDDDQASADGAVPETAKSAGNPKSGEQNAQAGNAADSARTPEFGVSVESMAAIARNEFGGVLPDTGAASTGILQAGIAMLAGGVLLAGTGRHRRRHRADVST